MSANRGSGPAVAAIWQNLGQRQLGQRQIVEQRRPFEHGVGW
jgi:hypothetical protein